MPANPFLLPYASGFLPVDFGVTGLAAPATLVKIAGTATTLTVQWSAVAGASAYFAQITDFENGNVYQTHTTTLTECTFDNLDPTVQYFVTVNATAPGSATIIAAFFSILEVSDDSAVLTVVGNASIINPAVLVTAQGTLAVVGNANIALNPLQAVGTLHVTGAAQIHQAVDLTANGVLHANGTGEFL